MTVRETELASSPQHGEVNQQARGGVVSEGIESHTQQPIITLDPPATSPNLSQTFRLYVARGVSIALGVAVIVGALFFTAHCAQLIANSEHHDVTLSIYLVVLVTLLSLFCSCAFFSFFFEFFLHRPFVKRYLQEGFETTGYVTHRQVTHHRHGKTYSVTLLYRSMSGSHYAKNFDLKNMEEFALPSFPLLVLPDIPTSAVFRQTIDSNRQCFPAGQLAILVFLVLLLSLFWIGTFEYAWTQLPAYDPWNQEARLWKLFAAALLCSVSGAYSLILEHQRQMLYGGARRISQGAALERQLASNNNNESQEEPRAGGPHNLREIV